MCTISLGPERNRHSSKKGCLSTRLFFLVRRPLLFSDISAMYLEFHITTCMYIFVDDSGFFLNPVLWKLYPKSRTLKV